jgi:hypothetical protein
VTEGRFCSELLHDLRKAYPKVIAHQHWTMPPSKTARFQPRNPYDFYIVLNGHFVAIEAKQIKGRSLPVAKYRPHQTEELLRVRAAGDDAWYLINIRDLLVAKAPEELQEFRYGKKVLACVFVPPAAMRHIVHEAEGAGRKSVPVELVVREAYAFMGRAKKGWDIEAFLNIAYMKEEARHGR